MSRPLIVSNDVLMARIDLLGLGVADTAKYVEGDDELMWMMNQATFSLKKAYDHLMKKGRS